MFLSRANAADTDWYFLSDLINCTLNLEMLVFFDDLGRCSESHLRPTN